MTMLMMQIVLTMRRKMEVPAAVLIEDPEGLSDVLLQVGLFELLGHHREELLKVNLTVAITIHLFEDHHLDCEETKSSFVTSLIISLSSATVGFCPRLFITVPSSFVLIVPDFIIDYKSC